MSRAPAWPILMLLIAASAAGQEISPASPPPRAPQRPSIVIRGCVQGTTLTSVAPDTTDTSGALTSGRLYRLTGPKALLKQIRQEHNGHLLDVTGTLQGADESRMVTGRKKIGRATVYAGKGQSGTPARSTETPTLEVEGFAVVQPACPASNLGR